MLQFPVAFFVLRRLVDIVEVPFVRQPSHQHPLL